MFHPSHLPEIFFFTGQPANLVASGSRQNCNKFGLFSDQKVRAVRLVHTATIFVLNIMISSCCVEIKFAKVERIYIRWCALIKTWWFRSWSHGWFGISGKANARSSNDRSGPLSILFESHILQNARVKLEARKYRIVGKTCLWSFVTLSRLIPTICFLLCYDCRRHTPRWTGRWCTNFEGWRNNR